MKNKLIKFGVVAIICLLIINFMFLIAINKKTNCDCSLFLEVHTIYQGDHFQEQVEILEYNTKTDAGLILAGTNNGIYIKFYNLDVNKTYTLDKGCCFDHEFTNTTEIIITMIVIEDNWACLSYKHPLNDIVWIWIGDPYQ